MSSTTWITSAPPTLLALTPCAHLTSYHSSPGFFSTAWSLDAPSSIAASNAEGLTVAGGFWFLLTVEVEVEVSKCI
jgi:hypothetical protein